MKNISLNVQGKDFVNALSPNDLATLYIEIEGYKRGYLKLCTEEIELAIRYDKKPDFEIGISFVVQERNFNLIGKPADFAKLQDYVTQRLTFFSTPSLIGDKVKNLEESIRTEILESVPAFKKTLESVYEILDGYPMKIENERDVLIIKEKEEKSKKGKIVVAKGVEYSAKTVLKISTDYGLMTADFNVSFGMKDNNLIIYHYGTVPFSKAKEEEHSIDDVVKGFKLVTLGDSQFEQLAYLKGIRKVLTLPDLIIKTIESENSYLKECLAENQ
jgi:hypothetical protein